MGTDEGLGLGYRTVQGKEGMMAKNPSVPANPGLVARALQLRAEVEQFRGRWGPLPSEWPRLTFTWEELERQLVDLAPSDLQAELVHRLVERTRLLAELKPAEMVLREVLRVAALVLDDAGAGREDAA
jgi:hypothetical protein